MEGAKAIPAPKNYDMELNLGALSIWDELAHRGDHMSAAGRGKSGNKKPHRRLLIHRFSSSSLNTVMGPKTEEDGTVEAAPCARPQRAAGYPWKGTLRP